MRTVEQDADAIGEHDRFEQLPERVQEALGELAGAAKEGLLALSVGVGLGVLAELMEAEVDEVVGQKGRHDSSRTAVRHGHEDGEVTLGGRRVSVERPRARRADGQSEVALSTYAHFADRDPLAGAALERMLAGVSTRRYGRVAEPVGADVEAKQRSSSKSAVSRQFVSRTREHLIELMSRPLADLRLAVLMLDGIELKGRCCVVALGIDTDGHKHPLGLWDGSTENARVATTLLANLAERGLDAEQGVLVVLDGAKALRKAVDEVLGRSTPVQRCIRHKERNVAEHLPERAPPGRQAPAAGGVGARGPRGGPRAAARAGRRARALPPRCRSLAARGPRGDADRHPPRRPRRAQADAVLDEPVRVDDRHRPPGEPQRQALAVGRHVPALDRRRHARSRASVPTRDRPPEAPRARRGRRARDRPPPRPRHPGARGRRYPRLRQFTSGPSPEVPRRTGHPPLRTRSP